MRRLLDAEDSPDLDEAFGARVLAAKQSHEVDAFMQDRVYAKLRRQRKRSASPARMRIMLAACFALVLVASASFASTSHFAQRVRQAVAALFAAPKPSATSAKVSAMPTVVAAPQPQVTALPVVGPEAASIPAPTAHVRKKELVAPVTHGEAPSSDDGPQIAVQAFDALRNRHDAASALRYIDAYEAEHATGALAEEMAALRMEALHASNDDGEIAAARDYLRRYPQGRFVARAQRAILP